MNLKENSGRSSTQFNLQQIFLLVQEITIGKFRMGYRFDVLPQEAAGKCLATVSHNCAAIDPIVRRR
jgi:hypothetical protein